MPETIPKYYEVMNINAAEITLLYIYLEDAQYTPAGPETPFDNI